MRKNMTYKECREYIRSDYYRFTSREKDSMLKMWLKSYFDTGFHFLFWWRMSHVKRCFLARIISRYIGRKHNICIERFTDIGYGFYIVHGGPVVVNCHAHIGNNCNLFQFSTIGGTDKGSAFIEDNVNIFPSVCIIGNVNVGSNSTIGAGSVVVKDVPAGATVAGNPARVISWKEPGRFVWKKWNIEEK